MMRFSSRLLAILVLGHFYGDAPAAVTGQWDFNTSNLTATVGTALAYRGDTSSGTLFTTATIAGKTAVVMRFPATTPTQGYTMSHGISPNGGGNYVNQYTLVMDIMFPAASSGQWRALLQTNPNNSNDGDLFVNTANAIGISGIYHGALPADTWHRVAFVVDLTLPTQQLSKFIDGQLVGTQDLGAAVDGRWSLDSTALLFADEDNETRMGYVNSIQIRSEASPALDIAAMGGATAEGIPIPPAPTALRVTSPNGGEQFAAGTPQTVTWVVSNPTGFAQIDLYRGAVLLQAMARVPLAQSNYLWTIPLALGDTNNYRVRVTSVSYPAMADSSDGAFAVYGSVGNPNLLFGQPLQANGDFESSLAGWLATAGDPLILTGADGKGAPHGGTNFLHGGTNTSATNTVVRQDIDLIAAGFTPSDLDTGAVLDANAWLRNFYGAGTFDDQVFCRVGYLDAAGQELSAVRCMIAANNIWLQRGLSGLLPLGTRKLRVEVIGKHRRDADNDSMADDVDIRLQKPFLLPTPVITKLPMLQDVRTAAMTLIWETDGNLAWHYVDWGRTNCLEHTLSIIESLQIDATHFVHRATLAGLQTGTRYVYRVRSGTNTSAVYSFTTAPGPSTPLTTAWWGDNHGGTATLARHVTNLLAHSPNLICVAGDMVDSGNAIAEWHNYWFKPLETLNAAQTIPVIYARGNHDGEHALSYAYSALPGNESWFAFDYGNCRFIFLDSEAGTSISSEQYNWLRAELKRPETQKAAFRIVCFHRLPFANLWNGGGYTGETWVRNDWVPLFTSNNVDIVICGHAHNYNRGLTNGVTYIVTGGGGGLIDTEVVANWPLYTVQYSQYHFDVMTVNGPRMLWRTYNDANQLLDTVTLQSRVPLLAWRASPGTGGMGLVVNGKPGTAYTLEFSTNLLHWTGLTTNTIPISGPPEFVTWVPLNSTSASFRARTQD